MRLLLATALLGLTAWAQVQPAPLFASAYLAAFPGGTVHLAVVVDIEENWAIPAAEATIRGLAPTRLSLELPPGFLSAEVVYPAPKKKWLPFLKAHLDVYEGPVIFLVALTLAEDAPLGLQLVRIRLEYQACTATVCLLPEALDLSCLVAVVQKPPARRTSERDSHGFAGEGTVFQPI
mgnify:CR=1 FL=1|jgi:DsbC/DsbD-like thiol-disulfide interchange protein